MQCAWRTKHGRGRPLAEPRKLLPILLLQLLPLRKPTSGGHRHLHTDLRLRQCLHITCHIQVRGVRCRQVPIRLPFGIITCRRIQAIPPAWAWGASQSHQRRIRTHLITCLTQGARPNFTVCTLPLFLAHTPLRERSQPVRGSRRQ